MSRSTVERTWQAHGLDCAVLRMDLGHRCGYVSVPESHPWHGTSYEEPAPEKTVDNSEFTAEDVGTINAFLFAIGDDEKRDEYNRRPEFQVRVHGGLTYTSQKLPGCPDGWWFGFDCAHADDSPDDWTEQRVVDETERLAEQLAAVARTGVPR